MKLRARAISSADVGPTPGDDEFTATLPLVQKAYASPCRGARATASDHRDGIGEILTSCFNARILLGSVIFGFSPLAPRPARMTAFYVHQKWGRQAAGQGPHCRPRAPI